MIRTDRLMLLPLTCSQEILYMQDNGLLEAELDLIYMASKLPSELKEVISNFILPGFLREPENFLFFTSWIVIDLDLRTIVADIAFKGRSSEGSSEVGYGTYPGFEGKGYMTEALKGLVAWAYSRPELIEITAETTRLNHRSIRVLQKNGFDLMNSTAEYLYWAISVSRALKYRI